MEVGLREGREEKGYIHVWGYFSRRIGRSLLLWECIHLLSLSATWISGTHLGEAKRQKLPEIGHGQNEQYSIGNIIIGMHENIFASSSGRFAIFISVQAILPSSS